MRKKIVMLVVVILLALAVCFFYIYKAPMAKNIVWGAAFSQKHAVDMGLDWKETYSALLDDLKVKNIKLAAHWDIVEPRNGVYAMCQFGPRVWAKTNNRKRSWLC